MTTPPSRAALSFVPSYVAFELLRVRDSGDSIISAERSTFLFAAWICRASRTTRFNYCNVSMPPDYARSHILSALKAHAENEVQPYRRLSCLGGDPKSGIRLSRSPGNCGQTFSP
jgi:hypothetical protein